MDALKAAKYISFGTYRKDGTLVSTPTWIVPFREGYAFTTEPGSNKTKRLARDPRVVVAPCNVRGRVSEGASTFTGKGELLEGSAINEVQKAVRQKYGLTALLIVVVPSRIQKLLGKTPAGTAAIYFVTD
jgi:hypothetical protein